MGEKDWEGWEEEKGRGGERKEMRILGRGEEERRTEDRSEEEEEGGR